MEREIKFRAWDKDRKKMIYRFADKLNMKGYVLLWSTDNDRLFCGNYMDNGDWQEPELMQFTGLKDKNGKEIYEGDIIACVENKFGTGKHEYWSVDYEEASFVAYNQLNSNRILEHENGETLFYPAGIGYPPIECELIGNIYETPELLK